MILEKMNEPFRFLVCLISSSLVGYLWILVLNKMVHFHLGWNVVPKRWGMALKTFCFGFFLCLGGGLLSGIFVFLQEKFFALLAVLVFFAGFFISGFGWLGCFVLLITGRKNLDISTNSDWDFWKFLRK